MARTKSETKPKLSRFAPIHSDTLNGGGVKERREKRRKRGRKKADRSWRPRDNGYFDFRNETSPPSFFPPLSLFLCRIHAARAKRKKERKKRGSKCKSWRASFKRIPLLIRLVRIRLSESALLCTRRRRALDNVSPRTERTLARIV